MLAGLLTATAAAAGLLAWGVRGRSSTLLAPSVWRGPRGRRVLALTFDDGPSEQTPELLDLLALHGVPATFFAVGAHARRLPQVAQRVVAAGHELGNHTDTHARLYLRTPVFIRDELRRAQDSLTDITGVAPRLFRPTYGARWFGLARAQRELGLLGVMWTVIARDWTLNGPEVARRLMRHTGNGYIYCLHDGRERTHRPDIGATLAALREAIPRWKEQGYEFRTVSGLVFPPA
jgi:peptidoglycan/xylan/chitin deacetylase (PgdA/CDA1 family)